MKAEVSISALPDEARVSDRTVAVLLGVSRSTVWNYASTGKIKKPSKLGGTTRWRLGDIRSVLQATGGAQ